MLKVGFQVLRGTIIIEKGKPLFILEYRSSNCNPKNGAIVQYKSGYFSESYQICDWLKNIESLSIYVNQSILYWSCLDLILIHYCMFLKAIGVVEKLDIVSVALVEKFDIVSVALLA